jgi:CheY-like chemotaxis protein
MDPPQEVRVAASSVPAPGSGGEPRVEVDRTKLVILADPDEERGKASAEAIRGWGLTAYLVHDGVEAMLSIQRMLPAAVVLDAALPKMFGFQVCEVVKRNGSLKETVVVLVGAIHHQDRYRRDPSDLYGADVYIEQPDLPEGLKSILRESGMPVDEAEPSDATATPAPQSPVQPEAVRAPAVDVATAPIEPDPMPEPVEAVRSEQPSFEVPVPSAPEPELESTSPSLAEAPTPDVAVSPPIADSEDPEVLAERERAQRLARIAVSEMLLYQPDKFEKAVIDGNLEQVLDLEIQEARALLRQRISEEVRAETDFIIDELERVAAERGGEG